MCLAAPIANGTKASYILIGGGPAGFVIAEYLTRDPNVHVVLLEAGPDGSTDPVITSKSYSYLSLFFMFVNET